MEEGFERNFERSKTCGRSLRKGCSQKKGLKGMKGIAAEALGGDWGQSGMGRRFLVVIASMPVLVLHVSSVNSMGLEISAVCGHNKRHACVSFQNRLRNQRGFGIIRT